MIKFFHTQWDAVPLVVLDTETTGKQPGIDKTVSFGLARFEKGAFVAGFEQLVNPGIPIPEEATSIHKITDEMVKDMPRLHEAFFTPRVGELLKDAQPAAYNAAYDRYFVPPFGERWDWPFLDVMMLIRKVDQYAKGTGRHRLSVTCERHGIPLSEAHSARADARACGELLYKVGAQTFPAKYTLGQAIDWCRRAECSEWFRFNDWLARQPPREAGVT